MFCDPGLTAARWGIYHGSSYQKLGWSSLLQRDCHHDCQDASPADRQKRCSRWFDQQEMLRNGLPPAACPVLTSFVPFPHHSSQLLHPLIPIHTHTIFIFWAITPYPLLLPKPHGLGAGAGWTDTSPYSYPSCV
jgi:hypothetical protein